MDIPEVPADGAPDEKADAVIATDDLDSRDMYPLIDDVMKEDWDDPAMDVYDHYERLAVPLMPEDVKE